MYKEVKRSVLRRDVRQNGGFILDERLKWLHGGYKVLLRDYRSINQSRKQKMLLN